MAHEPIIWTESKDFQDLPKIDADDATHISAKTESSEEERSISKSYIFAIWWALSYVG